MKSIFYYLLIYIYIICVCHNCVILCQNSVNTIAGIDVTFANVNKAINPYNNKNI